MLLAFHSRKGFLTLDACLRIRGNPGSDAAQLGFEAPTWPRFLLLSCVAVRRCQIVPAGTIKQRCLDCQMAVLLGHDRILMASA